MMALRARQPQPKETEGDRALRLRLLGARFELEQAAQAPLARTNASFAGACERALWAIQAAISFIPPPS